MGTGRCGDAMVERGERGGAEDGLGKGESTSRALLMRGWAASGLCHEVEDEGRRTQGDATDDGQADFWSLTRSKLQLLVTSQFEVGQM